MTISAALKPLFNQTVTIKNVSNNDGYDKPTYGTAKTYAAKIEMGARAFRTDDQREITNPRKIFLFTQDTDITPESQLTLPDAFPPINPQILMVRTVTDLPGISHVVLTTE
jgi:hypothetical protein